MFERMIRDPGRHCPDCGLTGVLDFTNVPASVRTYTREDGNYSDHNGPSSFTLTGWENSQVDIDAARRFLAAEFESAGLPHVAGEILAGTSAFGQGAYITAVAAALTAPRAACGCPKEATHG